MKKHRIPKIDSVKELAAFWDTHDLTDYDEDFEEVTDLVFERGKPDVVAVKLEPDESAAVKKIAKASKIGYKPLLHKWIAERLRVEADRKIVNNKGR